MTAQTRLRLGVAILALCLALAPGAAARTRAPLYVALGDSLSRGAQPDAAGVARETASGYPEQLQARLSGAYAGVKLVSLGCSGETSGSFVNGGVCSYTERRRTAASGGAGSQLAAAEAFLRRYRSRVRLVTVNIGINDLAGCFASTLPSQACIQSATTAAAAHGATIAAGLRAAAGPGTTIVLANSYDPFLGLGLIASRRFAAGYSVQAVAALNDAIAAGFAAAGARVADVFGAFATTDRSPAFTIRGVLVTRATERICALTYMCSGAPTPDVHATLAGYGVMADAILAALAA